MAFQFFMFIQRYIEREFSELLNDYPVVCLVGPRQVGKTSFIKVFIESLPDQTLYLDLEMPSDLTKLSDPQFYLEQHSDKTIIIDEVQHRRDLFPLLHLCFTSYKKGNSRYLQKSLYY